MFSIDSTTFGRLIVFAPFLLIIINSPDPKGRELLPSLGVRLRRKLFKKSSPLKVLNQWKPTSVRIITRVSSFKIVTGDAVHQPTWPLLLKIEHGKIAGFG